MYPVAARKVTAEVLGLGPTGFREFMKRRERSFLRF
jgi:hypothetical protein